MVSLVTGSFNLVNSGETQAAYQAFSNNLPGLASSITTGNSQVPKAYLNYIIFDENNVYEQFGYKAISTAALNAFEKISLSIDVPSNGTLYIYVANESNVNSNVNVFFDDLLIVHEKNSMGLEVKSSADYYPFGAGITSLFYQKEGSRRNTYGYQGVYAELDEETGWHAFELRQYDSYLGRWTGVDPYAQYSSPYVGMGNVPHMGVDPDGGFFGMGPIASGAVIGATVATAVGAIRDDNFSSNWYKWTLGGAAAGAGLGFAYERATSVYTATGRTAKDPKYSSSQSLKKGGSFKLPSVNIPSGAGDAVNLVSSVGSASGFVGASSRFPEINFQKDLIDLSRADAGERLVEALRYQRLNKLKPYLEDFVNINTELESSAEKFLKVWGSFTSSTSGSKKIFGQWVDITIWLRGDLKGNYKFGNSDNKVGDRRLNKGREDAISGQLYSDILIKNGSDKGIIHFQIRNNPKFMERLFDYMKGTETYRIHKR